MMNRGHMLEFVAVILRTTRRKMAQRFLAITSRTFLARIIWHLRNEKDELFENQGEQCLQCNVFVDNGNFYREGHTSKKRLIDEASSSETLAVPLPSSNEEVVEPLVVVEEMMPFEPEPSTSGTLLASAKVTQESAVVLEADNYLLKLELERKDQIIKTLRLHLTYDHIKNNEGLLLEYTGLK